MNSTRSTGALLLALAAMNAGCSAARPFGLSPSVPPAFTARPAAARDSTQTVGGAWWRSFGSEELNQLEAAALKDNLDLKGAEARLVQAGALASIAGAARYPAVDVQANRNSRSTGPYASASALAFVASYEIDFWGRNAARAGAAQYRESAARYDAQTVTITLGASVANTYFQVAGLRERLRLARRLAADARSLLRLVEIQQQIGTGAELQTELQRNAVATFDESAATVEQQLEQQQHQLAVLVGRPPEGFSAAAPEGEELHIPEIAPDTPAALLFRRPDIAASEAQLRAVHLDVQVSRAALLPSVSLTAALGTTIAPTHALRVIGAGIFQPVFHGGALRGQINYDVARATELEAQYRATVLAALQDVEDQLTAQTRVEQAEQAANIAVTSARRAAFLSEAQFKLGVADYLSVLTAERAQFQAEDTRFQIHVQRQQAAVNLFRALGGGFEEHATP